MHKSPSDLPHSDAPATPRGSRRAALSGQLRRLVRAIRDGDDDTVEQVIVRLSQVHRYLAPLALLIGAFVMLFEGVKLLFSNWRLSLVQVLPAMWIWAAMLDFKAHLLHDKAFHIVHGPILVLAVVAIAAITAASFFLNAVFAFAVATPPPPQIRPAFTAAGSHRRRVLGWGFAIGLCLGFATLVADRWGSVWFAVSLSLVIGAMSYLYVALPSRLIGTSTTHSKSDALKASAVGGALGAIVCAPPVAIGRVGLLMLGSPTLFVPGLFVLTLGLVLQTGATSSVKAIKLSAKLVSGHQPQPDLPATGS